MIDPDIQPATDRLAAELGAACGRAAHDPFANPVRAFARTLAARMGRGELTPEQLGQVVSTLTAQAFAARAERLGRYLGGPDPDRDLAAIEGLFETLADRGFETFAGALARPAYGPVLTGHPTFALDRELSLGLVELACGRDASGRPLTDAERDRRLELARTRRHRPPSPLTIDVEHAWSVEALENAAEALHAARRAALRVARRRWPERWRQIEPQLAILATWVGFDTDGRTDIGWSISIEKRLDLKRRALQRQRRALTDVAGQAAADARAMLDNALGVTADQLGLAGAVREDPACAPELARALVAGRPLALVDPKPLLALMATAAESADGAAAEELLAARAAVAAQGLSLARVHVRLNAARILSAIRSEIDLPGGPDDPANRRAWFAAADDLLESVRPLRINFGSLAAEPAPARQLVMMLAQTAKFIDGYNPTRFLIAEAESGFILLAALYYARLFGIEDTVEISPLFETEQGLARGEAVFEEALKSGVYRAHLQRQGRLAIEFGYSDSGRFIGQMAATFRIERMQLRLAEMLEREGLQALEVVLFDTHGESIGRGGHPDSLADRLRYACPPRARAEFTERGLAVREETSFQGGEGFLPFFTPAAAVATMRGILQFAYGPAPEAEPGADPVYDAPEFASDFFATVQQAFSDMVEDPDYAALLGLFETRLLHHTGSRPEQRQRDGRTGPRSLREVGELRAIPNNGVLQQLGYLANTLYGVGLAASRDRAAYEALRRDSPRFGRAMRMVEAAWRLSDLAAIQAYAAVADPAFWLACESEAAESERPRFEGLARTVGGAGLHEALERVLRALQAEHLRLRPIMPAADGPGRTRLLLLHAIRAAALQRIARLAADLPPFNPLFALSREALQERLIRLDVPAALDCLEELFPRVDADPMADADWGEPADYRAEFDGYAQEHAAVFEPLRKLHALALDITSALSHEIGACG